MKIIGCDLHTRYQQVAMLDTDTGELVERRLEHESGAKPYRSAARPISSDGGNSPQMAKARSGRESLV